MMNNLECGDDLSPATNGAANSGVPIRSNGKTEVINGTDEKELSSMAKRLIVGEVNRLVNENKHLRQMRDKRYDADKKLAINALRKNDFLSTICLVAGSAGLGTAPVFLNVNAYASYVLVGLSALLLIGGIAARIRQPLPDARR
jgi:hypothetical protein